MKEKIKSLIYRTLIIILLGAIVFLLILNLDAQEVKSQEITTPTVIRETTVKVPYPIYHNESNCIVRDYEKDGYQYNADIPLDYDLQEYIFYLANSYSVDATLIMALIEHESQYITNIVSATNDYGLMQINGINEDWLKEDLGITSLLEPYDNVHCGIYILANLFEKYEDVSLVLMAYNMGENGAQRLWEQNVYESNYSRCVIEIYDRMVSENENR